VMVQVLLARVLKCAKNRSVAVEPKYDPPHAIVTARPLDPAVQAVIYDGNMTCPASLLFHPSLSLSLSFYPCVCAYRVCSLSLSIYLSISLGENRYAHADDKQKAWRGNKPQDRCMLCILLQHVCHGIYYVLVECGQKKIMENKIPFPNLLPLLVII